jgi:hypothetical protein
MRIDPLPGDSPAVLEIKDAIEKQWEEVKALRKRTAKAEEDYGLLRGRLSLEALGLREGEKITFLPKGPTGIVEISGDSPHLWLRMIDKTGKPLQRRLRFDDDMPFTREAK